mmetsp:Transcript_17378/g.40404  ORF Transcript_17378/g.40404 Transcript_17378/m.40404 type:complete len:225 (-) Transcript_17378:4508-5182(-)
MMDSSGCGCCCGSSDSLAQGRRKNRNPPLFGKRAIDRTSPVRWSTSVEPCPQSRVWHRRGSNRRRGFGPRHDFVSGWWSVAIVLEPDRAECRRTPSPCTPTATTTRRMEETTTTTTTLRRRHRCAVVLYCSMTAFERSPVMTAAETTTTTTTTSLTAKSTAAAAVNHGSHKQRFSNGTPYPGARRIIVQRNCCIAKGGPKQQLACFHGQSCQPTKSINEPHQSR